MADRNVFAGQSTQFRRPGFVADHTPTCFWRGCRAPQFADTPVCQGHALVITSRVREAMLPELPDVPEPTKEAFVYYLMIGPATVKIGTTTQLQKRIAGLRTELQYVVAIELGDRSVERQRHQQFAADRIGKLENFRLSDDLKRHIEALQPYRDEAVEYALSLP